MKISIVLKSFVGLVFTGGSLGWLSHMLLQEDIEIIYLGDKSDQINIYAVSKKIIDHKLEKDFDFSTRNYVCKFDLKYYECEINLIKGFDAKTNSNYLQHLTNNDDKSKMTNDSLKIAGVVYRISINKSIDWMQDYKDIEIIHRGADKGTKYAHLHQLFALNSENNAFVDNLETKYFIAKYSSVNTSTTTIKNENIQNVAHKSLFSSCSTDSNVAAKTWKELNSKKIIKNDYSTCDIYNLSDGVKENWKIIDFENSKTLEDIKLVKDKHYLFKLQRESKINDIKQIKMKQNLPEINKTTAKFSFLEHTFETIIS